MYQVTAKVAAVEEDFPGSRVEWKVGQTREVHDSLIERFRNNPAAWTLSGGATSSPVMAITNPVTGGIDILDASGEPVVFDNNPLPYKFRVKTRLPSWIWKHHSTTQNLVGSFWVYVPIGSGYYATFGFGRWCPIATPNVVPHIGRHALGLIGSYLMHTAGSGVVKTGTWNTSALDYAPAGTLSYSQVAGDTITFSVTGHTLVARTIATLNGGYLVVAIDGDYTAATRLPTFTQSDYDAGLCRATDIGRRYINTGANGGALPDLHIPLADGLSDSLHVVTFEATGTKPSYSSAARGYIGGVVGCSVSDVGQNLVANTRVIAIVENVQDANQYGASAMVWTPEIEKAAAGTWEFLGEVHAGETQEAFEISVDAADQSALAVGAYASGSVISIRRVTTLASTDATATPLVRKTFSFTLSAFQDVPCQVSWTAAWLADKRVRSAYPLMLPVANEPNHAATAVINNRWDSINFGTYKSVSADLSGNANAKRGQVPALLSLVGSSLHRNVAYAVMLDGGRGVDGFSKAAPEYVFMHDRADGYDKVYFNRSTQQSIEKFVTGDVIGGVVGFGIVKL